MKAKGPERLGEIIARLFVERGWGRKQERLRLEQAWAETAGAEIAAQTRLGSVRRGTLEIVVGNAVLLQELVHFHKRRLLQGLQRSPAGATLSDLRFRAGALK